MRYLLLSLAVHAAVVGGIVWLRPPLSLAPGADDGYECPIANAADVEDDFAAVGVPLPDPAVGMTKSETFSPASLGSGRAAAAVAEDDARRFAPRPAMLSPRRWPAAGFDSAAALRAAIPGRTANAAELAQHYLPQVEKIPQRDLDEIAAKLRADYGVENRAYAPRQEAKDARKLDVNHSVTYYRIVAKDGRRLFQELLLDRNGNYMVSGEKPESKMDLADRMKLQLFSNSALDSVRNLTLGLIEKKLDEPSKEPPRPPAGR